MGDKPSPAHSIDRKDNSAGYFQENCHWVTRSVQNQNRRTWSKSNTGIPGVGRRFGKWHVVITVGRTEGRCGEAVLRECETTASVEEEG